ncbi:MAG: SRPBCC family protein [Pseudomonadota bacterium]|jgi:carbon monoxide dehydrogenase subunit G
MEIKGERILPAKRELVWAALNDAGVLQRSIPGCETIDKVSDTELNATLTLKVGPVKARFKGNVKLVDLEPPQRYTIVGEGQGGVAGFGKMKATVTLAEEAGGTRLSYVADAQVGGKLAQVGSRLIEGTAAKLAQEFFDAFERNIVPDAGASAGSETAAQPAVAAPVAAEPPAAPSASEAVASAPSAPAPAAQGMSRWAWPAALVAAFLIALWLVGARG